MITCPAPNPRWLLACTNHLSVLPHVIPHRHHPVPTMPRTCAWPFILPVRIVCAKKTWIRCNPRTALAVPADLMLPQPNGDMPVPRGLPPPLQSALPILIGPFALPHTLRVLCVPLLPQPCGHGAAQHPRGQHGGHLRAQHRGVCQTYPKPGRHLHKTEVRVRRVCHDTAAPHCDNYLPAGAACVAWRRHIGLSGHVSGTATELYCFRRNYTVALAPWPVTSP